MAFWEENFVLKIWKWPKNNVFQILSNINALNFTIFCIIIGKI